ncbi:uncharacterized protein LOC103313667 [Tribolium castaneum]|uniref:MARVEL domain-containing protein n=1 Tax=Tribolium castaneum TaxID=7070 RepID=D6WQ68_TRICA|nr:PREDICTED: uncharacterized protein LOC103313667 [Tribolium castaneum]EFA06930.2 hypothetical protein TcasGA2_TC009880 [Tribolium castaneum]|eukprot:XP_008195748.1 PREDICTED: uncharacterized protein LOC103313667 [Tribolium castaneum]
MAERAINQKKAQFLNTFAPKSASFDELVRDKLEPGKFLLTKTGWTKILAIIVCLAALALFLAQSWDQCYDRPDWFTTVFPVCVGCNVGVQFLFYLMFSCGGTVKYPGKWVTADIILNLIFSLVGIIGSVMTVSTTIECRENPTMHKVPGFLGIVGGVLSVVGCAAIFLMYRYVEEEDEGPVPQTPLERNIDLRKSIHA